jgi:hypothetical protein
MHVFPVIVPPPQFKLLGLTQPPKRHWVPAAVHLVPHAPQLFESVFGSTQAPEHAIWPVGQAQVLGELGGCGTQVAPVAQALVHDPQCCRFVVMSTHWAPVPQGPSPELHWQVPAKQNWSLGQVWPHEPQFAELPVVSTHELPHWVRLPQPLAHLPAEHTMPLAQAVPQPPQFLASEAVSMHVPEQLVCPLRQPQVPALHTCPVAQA